MSALLLVPVVVAAAHAAEPDPLVRPEDRTAVLQALAAADITVADLSWDKDYLQADGIRRDRWRLPGIEALLHAPLDMPADAARWSGALTAAAGDPVAALRTAIEALGRPRPGVEPVVLSTGCAPAEKRAWRKLHPVLQDAVCSLARVQDGAPLVDGPGWLEPSDAHTLRTLLAPDGEDAWSPTEAQQRTRSLLFAIEHITLARRLETAVWGLQRLQGLESTLGVLPAGVWPSEVLTFTVRGAIVAVGTPGADQFAAPLTLDPGGADLYVDPAAALTMHLDLGGDDVWTGGDGSLGGTVGGVALLVDVAGDDTYRGGQASLGAGVGGVGVLVDRAGNDSYRGLSTTQGAGFVGIGLLLDGGGSDSYDAAAYAQGFAETGGYGALWDAGGDDVYRAGGLYPDMPTRLPEHTLSLSQGFSIGLRPDAGGGLGLLVDESGNDAYDADLFAQGCSYWFSRGYLVDRAGNDRYHTFQYGQGSGIHLSVAGLFDLAGNDAYSGGNLVQGSSHDLSVGWLYDRSGDDVYAARSTAQGGSLTNSVTFQIDAAGDDAYIFRQPFSRGAGRFDRHMGSVGAFVDVSGVDRYDDRPGNDAVVRPWAYGIAVDGTEALPPPDPITPPPPLRVLRDSSKLASLVRQAPSDSALAALAEADSVSCKDPPACEAKRAELAAGGVPVFAALLPALQRDILAEGYTLDALLRAMRSPENDPSLHALLLEHVGAGPSYQAERWIMRWLGELAVDPDGTAKALEPLAADPDPRLRGAVADAILAWRTNPPVLATLVADPEPTVRAVAALALGAGGAPAEQIAPLLLDPSVLVRFDAAAALLSRPADSVRPSLLALWRTADFPTPASRRLVLEMLIRVGGKEAAAIVRTVAAGDSDPWAQRKAASPQEFEWQP